MLWVSEGLWGITCISLGRRENPAQVLDGNPAALGWATAVSSRELVTDGHPGSLWDLLRRQVSSAHGDQHPCSWLSPTATFLSVSAPRHRVTKYHREHGGLKQQKATLSQLRRPEARIRPRPL